MSYTFISAVTSVKTQAPVPVSLLDQIGLNNALLHQLRGYKFGPQLKIIFQSQMALSDSRRKLVGLVFLVNVFCEKSS